MQRHNQRDVLRRIAHLVAIQGADLSQEMMRQPCVCGYASSLHGAIDASQHLQMGSQFCLHTIMSRHFHKQNHLCHAGPGFQTMYHFHQTKILF
jgi:hypothetical protein